MPPQVDLVVTFRASQKIVLSKQQIRDDAQKAEQQYARLLETLKYGGLRAVARRGEALGHLLIFVYCPEGLVKNLVKRERYVISPIVAFGLVFIDCQAFRFSLRPSNDTHQIWHSVTAAEYFRSPSSSAFIHNVDAR